MAFTRHLEASPHDKSFADLGRDALWFTLHTLLAVVLLAVVWGIFTLTHPDPESSTPKIFASALAFVVPLLAAFALTRATPHDPRNHVAPYVWIAALIFFSSVCVWVLDLPTGPGLCNGCTPIDKLWRTFFDINHGSGLMSGDGLLVGAWVPLAILGYSAGATFGLEADN